MSLHLRVGELQRVVGQLEEDVAEQAYYALSDRTKLGAALSDLAVRIEVVRCALLDPEPEQPR